MYDLDFSDAKSLELFAIKTVELAGEYQNARNTYASSLKDLKIALAKAYQEGTVKESLSEDKAFVILSNQSLELKTALENVIEDEQTYKGLEKVLDARQSVITLYQSILKNTPK